MKLNELKAISSNKSSKRVGRGAGSGNGKTSGKGHKGQKARSGGRVRPGFEGGQMPIQQRLPKFGFVSKSSKYKTHIKLSDLNNLKEDIVDIDVLKLNKLISKIIKEVKIINSGELKKAVKLKGLKISKSASEELIKSGGEII
jgi:large subunit ribosomal protein L15